MCAVLLMLHAKANAKHTYKQRYKLIYTSIYVLYISLNACTHAYSVERILMQMPTMLLPA